MPNSTCTLSVILLLLNSLQTVLADEDFEPPNCKFCPDDTGWTGTLETGISYQNEDDYHFGRYSGDFARGTKLDINALFNYTNEEGLFISGEVGDAGRETASFNIQGGYQGQYEGGFEYDQITNYRQQKAYTPYQEEGSQLLLPGNWVSGPTTQSMPELAASLHTIKLSTERDRSKINFKFFPDINWQISAFIRHEEKQGIKDFAATFGFTQSVILPLPIDYINDDIGLTLDYNKDHFQSQISYTTSQFKNRKHEITWQNPYQDVLSDSAFGSIAADSPDNESQQLSAILGYQISDTSHVSARLASGSMKQNEDFAPYTLNSSIASAALPVDSLNGTVKNTLASVQINSRPADRLRVDASYTYSNRDNQTSINSYDIITTDIAAGGTRKNRPYSYKQNLLRVKAEYRLQNGMNLSGGYDDDKMDRDYTNVEQTQDKTIWLKLKSRLADNLESTIKFSHSKRDATEYSALSDSDPLLDYPNPNFYNNELLRIHNIADRDRDKLGFGINYTPTEEVTLGLDVDYIKDEYDQMYLGLQQAKGLVYTASVSYFVSEALTTSLYYSHDKLTSDQNGNEKLLPTDTDNIWIESDSSLTNTLGVSINWIAIKDELDISAELTRSRFNGTVDYANAPSLPDLSSTLTALSVHGTYTLSEELSMGMELRYESFEEDNWSNDGSVNSLPTLLSLGTGEFDNTTSLVLVSLKYIF